MSGPAARASGVDLDLRLQTPYLAYRELAGLITPRDAARAMPSRDWAFSLRSSRSVRR